MKVASFVHQGRASYGVVSGGRVHDLGRVLGADCPTLREAIARGEVTAARAQGASSLALAEVTLLPPIPHPDKIICIGLNYRAHAAEGGFKVPEHPSVFVRLTSTLAAAESPMVLPVMSSDFDYEGELAVIIGRPGRHIDKAAALRHVFGYSCFNDGSLRDIQFKHSLTAGKNFPSTGAFGPWIATADEIPDPSQLTLTTCVNGREVQHRAVSDMIFDVPAIIAYVSQWAPLLPGDVIATGTPEGVGFARKPPLWLRAGDTVEVEISGIGTLRNPVVGEPPAPPEGKH
jgi:2-keto-4-pentenoate hydratase/2-oxohepta-3-ene-1,7-dioic acid hydratase in catechol pathway